MVILALKAGLRQGELLALRWEDIDLVTGLLRVRRSVTRGVVTEPKSGKGRDVPLGDEAIAALKAERHLRGPLVFCDAGRADVEEERVQASALARLQEGRVCGRIGWHVLRHTFASHLVMRGAAMKVVQELLGHATIEMTMRYAHLSPDVPRHAVKLLDGLRQPGDRRTRAKRWATGGRQGPDWYLTKEIIVEAPGVEPGSGSAPLKSLRAYPAIWFSSRGWPTGGASSRLASEVSRPRPQAPARPLAR